MIKQYFKRFGIFTEKEIEHTLSLFKERSLRKSDLFIREGAQSKEVAFIRSGIFRSYYMSDEGTEITYCFRFPNDLMAAYSSFITGSGSMENMQAIAPAELLVIRKEAIDQLIQEQPAWTTFLKIIAEQQYIELEKRVFQLQRNNAAQRYGTLLAYQPEYIQHIPLQYLASYLGITQRHLSRIRKEISF